MITTAQDTLIESFSSSEIYFMPPVGQRWKAKKKLGNDSDYNRPRHVDWIIFKSWNAATMHYISEHWPKITNAIRKGELLSG